MSCLHFSIQSSQTPPVHLLFCDCIYVIKCPAFTSAYSHHKCHLFLCFVLLQSWNRLSRLQRTIILSLVVLCLLCSAYVLPLLFEDIEDTSVEVSRLAGRQKALHGDVQHMSLEEEEKLSKVKETAHQRLKNMVVSWPCFSKYGWLLGRSSFGEIKWNAGNSMLATLKHGGESALFQ